MNPALLAATARRWASRRSLRAAAVLGLAVAGIAATQVPWTELTEADWVYSLVTRFSLVDGHPVHYPTPTAELTKLLEGRAETSALRHLADARLNLGDRKGALAAMEQWATAEGAQAWDETARWAAGHKAFEAAFRAAEKALPGLPEAAKRDLADRRIQWAELHPEVADALALRKARVALFPQDAPALEDYVRALEKVNRLPEADAALAASQALEPERRLLLRADLLTSHGDRNGAFRVLDGAVAEPWSMDFRRAYVARVDKGSPTSPAAWRTTLEGRFDAPALVRLATYFEGQGRGDALADLLRQVDRRYGKDLTRKDHLLLARLHGEIDAVPEAFRARLAAAHLGTPEEQTADLAALAHLALQAGSRPLAWGTYNDESYKWVAAMDRTPGFWTGGLSFLLTGEDWKGALERLENESLADRTFAAARLLAEELVRRAPRHADLPALRVALMRKHVERGEGAAALALLPLVESGPAATADEARGVALLAARQTAVPLAEELRLFKARLKFLAPEGSHPMGQGPAAHATYGEDDATDAGNAGEGESRPWARPRLNRPSQDYPSLLEEGISRLDQLNPDHRASLDLILGELDRLPDDEQLWLHLASRLENWNLDDELGPRFDRALKRFQSSDIWDKAARWYARRNQHQSLRALAQSVADRFRGTTLFGKVRGAGDVRVEVPEQPTVGGRVRMVLWADWVRLKALERFPHSPAVVQQAQNLVALSAWQSRFDPVKEAKRPYTVTVAPDGLLEARRWAILFVDGEQREAWFESAMRKGDLEARLMALESKADRTPVDDLLLFEGWSRLSRFERAMAPGDRLAASYPGDGSLAHRVLSLHRSLNGLETSHAVAARTLVARTAPALEDPSSLWTELGELEEDRGRPQAALEIWQHLGEGEARNPKAIADWATLLWDYHHDREALAVVEAGRQRLNRPKFFAFETGVLRENLKDLNGAVLEYLNALRPEEATGFEWFEQDQRSLRRLAQLLARERVYRLVEARIRALKPGVVEDERTLAGYYPLAGIEPPAPGFDWDADAWIDGMDLPNDPVGRAQRADRKVAERPREYDAVKRIGDLLLEKTRDMAPQATVTEFISAAETWSHRFIEARWTPAQVVTFQNGLMARRAALAPSDEDRIQQEMARADFLAGKGRAAEADAVWASLDARIGALPEGTVRLKAEAGRAGYLERAKGVEAAAAEWRRVTGRFPWSLGLLEDRLAFLQRTGKGEEARATLESVLPKAAPGHREPLLERLTQDCLAAGDLPRARRAVQLLLATEGLEDARRLGAIHLMARLSLKENPSWDPQAFAKAESAKLKPELHAELYHGLARAVDLEGGTASVPGLWIEALNRRTEREWVEAAARSARRAGKGPELLTFYEKQLQRSPRDVRWAVAVRDIRKVYHDVEGAIASAKAAVAVRPEKEILWREAVELLVRADRPAEAADFLEGWNKPRLADEGVARWRSQLYAQAGDGAKALAIEQAALAAYGRENAGDEMGRKDRQARAAERLLEQGFPDLALRLMSPRNDVRDLVASRLNTERQAQIALLNNQFLRLLMNTPEADRRGWLASVLARQGRSDQREEVLAYLLKAISPISGQPSESALNAWCPVAQRAELEEPLRMALAQRLLAGRPGSWQAGAPVAFVAALSREVVTTKAFQGGGSRWTFGTPDVEGLWVRDLARRDRGDELLGFVEPRWQEMTRDVRALQGKAVGMDTPRQSWSKWLDDPRVLAVWARAIAAHPEKVKDLSDLLGNRAHWDRFWVLAARGWKAEPLLAAVTPETRLAWFRFWEPALQAQDPVLVARHRVVEQVTTALGRLLQGEPEAVKDPLIAKLRGPQTVGDVLGKGAQWTWPEFTPRRDAKGELKEEGDDRVIGSGVDQGRVPGALWGDRPGEAWYVLEALARHRQGDASAPYLPLDAPVRGGETPRALLAMRMARAEKNLPLALEIMDRRPGGAHDRAWLEGKVTLLVAAHQREQAVEAFGAFVLAAQAKLTEAEYRSLSALAEDAGLPPVLDLLDPSRPVGPAFLAYLRDLRPSEAGRFRTADPSGCRAALAHRWREREPQLTAEQIRYWLKELWAQDGAGLPRRGLAKLGGPWPHAIAWLDRQPIAERLAVVKAFEEALRPGTPNPELFARLAHVGTDDVADLLAVRVRLARNEAPAALALAEGMLAGLRRGEALAFTVPERLMEGGEGGGEEDGLEAVPQRGDGGDATVDRLRAWLAPFRDAKAAGAVEARFRAFLKEKRQEGLTSLPAWKLAFELTPAPEAPGLGQELEEAWFRGEVQAEELGPLTETLATSLPDQAPRWLARWPRRHAFDTAARRAAVWAALKRPVDGAKALFDGRRRAAWESREEVQAFDAWRRMGAPVPSDEKAPQIWSDALPAWEGKAEAVVGPLGARLKAHPLDVLSARAALRSPAGADEDALLRAGLALGSTNRRDGDGDQLLLRVRAARGLLPQSAEAAQWALSIDPGSRMRDPGEGATPEGIARLLVQRRFRTAEINGALADAARIARKVGNEPGVQEALRLLADRNAPGVKALRTELAVPEAPPSAYHLVNGRPAPIRPRDLTWSLLANVIKAEGVR
ncbi:MAG TPA: hypothetical protein VJ623_02680 [Holophagaceae bacterium]|nr:hypothetical protein [Holophagaceae bacterium]